MMDNLYHSLTPMAGLTIYSTVNVVFVYGMNKDHTRVRASGRASYGFLSDSRDYFGFIVSLVE